MRSKIKFLMIIGFLIIFIPYLGFPVSFKRFLTSILGALVILIAYMLKGAFKNLREKIQTMQAPSNSNNNQINSQ